MSLVVGGWRKAAGGYFPAKEAAFIGCEAAQRLCGYWGSGRQSVEKRIFRGGRSRRLFAARDWFPGKKISS